MALGSRDEVLGHQKRAADRDTARFFKDEARYHLRRFRAADLWFKWSAGEQGAAPPIQWPIELADELDQIHGLVTT